MENHQIFAVRMSQDQGAIVAEIQRLTGCRLHIERGSAEVRNTLTDDIGTGSMLSIVMYSTLW